MIIRVLLIVASLMVAGIGSAAELQQRPNIVILVADDMGWADVGYHGSPIKTPTIDRLAREGVELDRHYVAPVCTPTRTALLTGRLWSRFGNTAPSNTRVLPWDTVTLAGALSEVGYETAITGKWHLGSKPEWGPRRFGFDHSYGSLAGGVNPWSHLYKHGPYTRTWHRDDVLIDEEGHVTDLITEEAIRFIEADREKPFFLYVPFTAVHTPFDEPQKWLDGASHISEDRRQYAASTQHLDASIGRIIETLGRLSLLENTLIVFFSDNGGTNGDDSRNYPNTKPTCKIKGLNHPLRGWKTQVYEGGIRVPALVYWKDHLKPSKVTAAVHVADWMPTLCRLVGYGDGEKLNWDGCDIWPLLTGSNRQSQPRTLYVPGIGHRSMAIVRGDWKLIVHNNQNGKKRELYNLAEDFIESKDLAEENPEKVVELEKLLVVEEAKDNDALPID